MALRPAAEDTPIGGDGGSTPPAPPKPTIPEVFDRFVAYYRENLAWGSLHIVLDDDNVERHHVEFCIEYAEEHGDAEGAELGRILLRMSRTQMLRLRMLCWRLVFQGVPPPFARPTATARTNRG